MSFLNAPIEIIYLLATVRHLPPCLEKRGQLADQNEYLPHRELIRLRKSLPAIAGAEKETMEVRDDLAKQTLCVHYQHEHDAVVLLFHFGRQSQRLHIPLPAGDWQTLLDSASARWSGPGREETPAVKSTEQKALDLAPTSVLVLQKVSE